MLCPGFGWVFPDHLITLSTKISSAVTAPSGAARRRDGAVWSASREWLSAPSLSLAKLIMLEEIL